MPFYDLSGRGADVWGRIAEAVARGGFGQRVSVIAVTKTHPAEAVLAAAAAGFHDVGENKVQEALSKQQSLSHAAPTVPGDGSAQLELIRWHLIGHLQRNKSQHLRAFHLFHALDSSRLADAVQAEFSAGEAARSGDPPVPMRVLVQVNVLGEESKGGFSLTELVAESDRLMGMSGVTVAGVMTMAPLGADEGVLRKVFAGARGARDILCTSGHRANELSMGMSQDFVTAVEEGATMVRLGTVLFGERPR